MHTIETKISALFLLLILAFSTFDKAAMYVCFTLNQPAVTKAFCVNKGKPQLHCNGKCYLNKQLANEDNNTNKYPFQKTDGLNQVYTVFLDKEPLPLLSVVYSGYPRPVNNNSTIFRSSSIFHPPC